MKNSFLDKLGLDENSILNRDQLKNIVGGNEYPRRELKCLDDEWHDIGGFTFDFGEECPADGDLWLEWCWENVDENAMSATCF